MTPKKALTMDNETSQLLWSDVHDNHHWVHVVNDGSYLSFPERKRLSLRKDFTWVTREVNHWVFICAHIPQEAIGSHHLRLYFFSYSHVYEGNWLYQNYYTCETFKMLHFKPFVLYSYLFVPYYSIKDVNWIQARNDLVT